MFILSCSWVRLVECRGIESQALRPKYCRVGRRNFTSSPSQTPYVSLSTHTAPAGHPSKISRPWSYATKQSSSHFRLTLVPHRPTHPLRSIPITETSTLLWDDPTLAQASVLSPFVYNL